MIILDKHEGEGIACPYFQSNESGVGYSGGLLFV